MTAALGPYTSLIQAWFMLRKKAKAAAADCWHTGPGKRTSVRMLMPRRERGRRRR